MMSMHGMTMTLRYTPPPRSSTARVDAIDGGNNSATAAKPLSPTLARLRDWCCIGCAAIGLAVSLNLGTCEPEKRPSVFASRATPPASSNLSTLAPIMQTGPRKGDGVPRQSLSCATPKAARTVSKMPASAKPDAFAV